jgi:alkylhydroperoxidase family enzyme
MTQPSGLRVRETPFSVAIGAVPGVKETLTALSAALWSEEGATPLTTRELVFLRTSLINHCDG